MRWLALVLLPTTLLTPAAAIEGLDMGPAPPEISVQAYVSHDGVAPGGHLQLAVVYEIPQDAHIQINEFLSADPAEGELFHLGKPALPPTIEYDGEPVLVGNAVVRYDLAVAPDISLGEHEFNVIAGYQACTEAPIYACYAPEEKEVAVSIRVVPSGTKIQPQFSRYFRGARPPEAGKTPPEIVPIGQDADTAEGPTGGQVETVEESSSSADEGWIDQADAAGGDEDAIDEGIREGLADRLRGALARGSWIAFLVVFIAGFLTSFTPCVYPMIPITIGFVVKASTGRLSAFILSLFFVLGIAVIYSALGLFAAFGGVVFGAAMQSTLVTIFIAVVFTVMATSMFGAFDLSLPSSLQTKLQTGPRGGIVGAVLMGGVTGLVASPCVGPVLVVLLTWVAQVGRPVYGFTLLFTFALGLGLLFLVLGTFVGVLKSLPKAGAWMESVKHYFGFIFLGLAVYFLRPHIGTTATLASIGIIQIIFAAHVGVFSQLPSGASMGARWLRGIGVIFLIFGFFNLGGALIRHMDWLPHEDRPAPSAGAVESAELPWRTDEEAALLEARSLGKPVLIDFTAEWCGACHELDEKTWSDPAVAGELKRYVLLRLDLTEKNEDTQEMKARWKVVGMPTVIFLDPSGNEADRFSGFRPPKRVLPLLQRVG